MEEHITINSLEYTTTPKEEKEDYTKDPEEMKKNKDNLTVIHNNQMYDTNELLTVLQEDTKEKIIKHYVKKTGLPENFVELIYEFSLKHPEFMDNREKYKDVIKRREFKRGESVNCISVD